jgi:hypothetical protein
MDLLTHRKTGDLLVEGKAYADPAQRRPELTTVPDLSGNLAALATHPRDHRNGLIDRQAGEPVVIEAP